MKAATDKPDCLFDRSQRQAYLAILDQQEKPMGQLYQDKRLLEDNSFIGNNGVTQTMEKVSVT